jgi:hypothetical protein
MLGSGKILPDPIVVKKELSIEKKSFTMKVPLPQRKENPYAHE